MTECAICGEHLETHMQLDGRCYGPAMAKRIGELQAEVDRLKALCLRAAFYIGVRQGPEVDQDADALLKELRGET